MVGHKHLHYAKGLSIEYLAYMVLEEESEYKDFKGEVIYPLTV
jgi:hypothetical protein